MAPIGAKSSRDFMLTSSAPLQRSREAVLAHPRQHRLLAVIPAPPLPAVATDGIERLPIPPPARRTLQRWPSELTAHQLIERHGEKHGARHVLKPAPGSRPGTQRLGLQSPSHTSACPRPAQASATQCGCPRIGASRSAMKIQDVVPDERGRCRRLHADGQSLDCGDAAHPACRRRGPGLHHA